jgi:hypothetical protein
VHTLKGILDKKPSQIHQENKENLKILKNYKKDSPWVVVGAACTESLKGLNRRLSRSLAMILVGVRKVLI